ncbi:MAG: tripartite tricarboxylate transporter substrate binding protein [Pseudomonadota bacterium]
MQMASEAAPAWPHLLRTWCTALALGAACLGAVAQQDYPSHPVRLVVAGGADQLARILADRLTAKWGQAVFVEQKAGASGALATEFIASQPPDGYNLLLTTVAFSSQNILQKRPPGQGELAAVNMIATLPFVLVVNNDLPVKTLPELVAYAKAHPGTLNYGSAGIGAPGQMAAEMLKQMAGIDMVFVPYKTVAQAVTDVISGQIQLIFSPAPGAMALIKAGKVRPIAVGSTKRYSRLPDLPTVAESGYPDYLLVGWNGIHTAPRTPPAILDKIATDIAAVMASPEARERAEAAGFEPVAMTRPDFETFLRADSERIGKVIRDGNIKAE